MKIGEHGFSSMLSTMAVSVSTGKVETGSEPEVGLKQLELAKEIASKLSSVPPKTEDSLP